MTRSAAVDVGPAPAQATLGDTLVDAAPRPDAIVEAAIDGERLAERLRAALAQLDARERVIVAARHYVEAGDERTIEDLAGAYGISCGRVRQIEAGALLKLRAILIGATPPGTPRPTTRRSVGDTRAVPVRAVAVPHASRRTRTA